MFGRQSKGARYAIISIALLILSAGGVVVVSVWPPLQYQVTAGILTAEEKPIEPKTVHLPTPDSVRAVYMTSWVAGTPELRASLVQLIEETEINAVVIDIKDYTGRVSFLTDNQELNAIGSPENRIRDARQFIGELHRRDIYVIGRIAAFQDPYLVSKNPELAVRRRTNNEIWKDRKGLSWIDPGATDAWDYIAEIGREAYAIGFDELNFDYIRFPSDGDMKDIAYPLSGKEGLPKAEIIERFFAYLRKELRPIGAVLSADLFGMTTTNYDDLNIGQVLERAAPYFDFIAPMVYPSHYPYGFFGYANPNDYPYDIVKISLEHAASRLEAASSTPNKLRPWLQDFDYGGNYDVKEVKAQIQAVYDAGLSSWMLWSPSNRYTKEALNLY
jgi:hypothetical protein